MKTKEEILSKRIIKFPEGDRRLAAGAMTDEAIKRNVYAAMEEYAAQFKDSPYQGSAGVWRSAAKPPGITKWYVVKCEQRRFASLIYVDSKITLERVAKDIDVEIHLLEWLDDSAASPAGDGWTPLTSGNPLPDYDEPMLWITESGNQFVQALDKDESIQCFRDATKATHYRPLPSPPNKSA